MGAVAEQLARFRGRPFREAMLRRHGRPLAICRYVLSDDSRLVDLDDPSELEGRRLRPSRVATRRRDVTQALARDIFERENDACGLRWWSTLESSWINVTLFAERAAAGLVAKRTEVLAVDSPSVTEAREALGLGA